MTDLGPDRWHLRGYRPADLDAVREIAVRTGAAGRDATDLVEDRRLFAELWAEPYVRFEPEHAHLLDDGGGRAVGYAIGTVDAAAFEARCEREWWPGLRERHPLDPDGRRLDDLLIALIHRRPPEDHALQARFPSELHIDLLPEAQGRGWGRRMIEAVLGSLRGAGSTGVHLGTSAQNARAIAFYEHLGFERMTPVGSPAHAVDFGLPLAPDRPLLPDRPGPPPRAVDGGAG